jgi:TorA maturation chaperone TorD
MSNRFHILARAWLEEVQEEDLIAYEGLPGLSCALPSRGEDTLTELAVAFQQAFGFNVPPYESVFLDPSAMLMAPATARVEACYRRMGWTPPASVRVGAADHVGLELWLLGDLMQAGRVEEARALTRDHLAFLLPLLANALSRLSPHAFYAALAEESVDAVLALLDEAPAHLALPELPPRPRYLASGMPEPPDQADEGGPGLKALADHLLTPREAGLFLSRDDLGRMSRRLHLPPVMSSRRAMLLNLFRRAGEYDEVEGLVSALGELLAAADEAYTRLAARYPAWQPYARLWRERLAATRQLLQTDTMASTH